MQSYDFVELWAGKAMASTMVRKSGRCTAALDIDYFTVDPDHPDRSNHFDILTPSGFLFPGSGLINLLMKLSKLFLFFACNEYFTLVPLQRVSAV